MSNPRPEPPLPAWTGTAIPHFALYGEQGQTADAEFFHIEDIQSRSRLHAWEIRTHTHRGLFQTVFVLEGGAEVRLDDRRVTVAAPFAVTIPPATVHAFHFLPESHGFVLTVADALLVDGTRPEGRSLFDGLFAEARVVDLSADDGGMDGGAGRVASLLGHLMAEFRWPQLGRAVMVEGLVRGVLLLVARQHALVSHASPSERLRADLFSRFRALVEEHVGDHWPVPRYADALGLTENRLNRLCRTLAGKSAFDLVQDRLLLEARRRLIYIEAPVAVLAYELGFQDPAYFCRFFKKQTGMTPAAFRRARRPGAG